jgi:hypothetical protein
MKNIESLADKTHGGIIMKGKSISLAIILSFRFFTTNCGSIVHARLQRGPSGGR